LTSFFECKKAKNKKGRRRSILFSVYQPEEPEKTEKIKTPITTKKQRQNKRKKQNKLPKMKILSFNGFCCKVELEVKKPGKTEEELLIEKIARLQQNNK